MSAAAGRGRAGVYTVTLRVKEAGDHLIVVNVDKMLPDRSNVRLASAEFTLHGGENTFAIADSSGEGQYVTVFNRGSNAITVERYSILFDPM